MGTFFCLRLLMFYSFYNSYFNVYRVLCTQIFFFDLPLLSNIAIGSCYYCGEINLSIYENLKRLHHAIQAESKKNGVSAVFYG